MKIVLRHITPDDGRSTADLEPGEVVKNEVELDVDGRSRRFSVYLRADVLPDVDASLVYGDKLLEELLRFEPAGLSRLCRAVARHRRGDLQALPLALVEAEAEGNEEETGPRLQRLVFDPQTH